MAVWSELYDADELPEIVSWGVSEDDFLGQLELLDLGNEHAAYPVLDLSYVPDRMRVYIRAKSVVGTTELSMATS